MLDTFLLQGGKFLLDKETNHIYLVGQMKRLYVDIRDKEGKSFLLSDFAYKAGSAMHEQWGPEISSVSGSLQMLNQTPLYPMTVFLFNAGFGLGMIWERLRAKRGLTVKVTEESVTSSEMDEVVRRYSQSKEPEEEEDDDDSE